MNQRDRIYVREHVAEELRRLESRAMREVGLAIAEIRDELHTEVTALARRITEVHDRALRELTRLHAGGNPR